MHSDKIFDLLEWIVYIFVSFILAILINKFVILNANIPSGSMEKTIMTNDKLFVYRLSFLLSKPKRFDIIVFKYPDDESKLYIKRIIGLPGETLEIKSGKIYINNNKSPLKESFIDNNSYGDYGPYYIPENNYFVLGDNRNNSIDSRYWHNTFVDIKKIIGKPIFRYYPNFSLIK